MSRFNSVKLYIVQYLHTSSSRQEPVSAKRIAEYLCERNIMFDEEGVIRETEGLQHAGVPILCSDLDSASFYMAK